MRTAASRGQSSPTRALRLRRAAWPIFVTAFLGHVVCGPAADDAKPKLIVLIGIDQFRADYLEEYDEAFSGGFRRMVERGRWYPRAVVDHAPTLSYPGHTTLATGAHPRTHGVTSNAWVESSPDGVKRRVFVMRDETAQILGDPDATGVSPRNLLVTGLADWVRAADPEARAVALSTGPALAMVYGGRALADQARNHAYWLSATQGRFVTSSYFRSAYPDWLQEFNDRRMPQFRANRVWESSVPEIHRRLARADAADYEGDGVHTTFPHAFTDVIEREDGSTGGYDPEEAHGELLNRWFFDSPFADEALFALTRTTVESLQLGQRGATDFLAIAIKSVDRIGHDYGPRSQEQLDVLVRLDRLLGDFLEFLDDRVGEGKYVIALSADHGAPNVVEYELGQGRSARRVSEEDIQNLLDRVERLVTSYEGPAAALPDQIAAELERADFVARAMTPAELGGAGPADEVLRIHRNSHVPGRSTPFPLWTRGVLAGRVGDAHPANWGIVVEFTENAQLWTAPSTHMSVQLWDREVPVIFMGPGVRPGVSDDLARTVDVAPSLAALAGLAYPASVDGKDLQVR